MYKACIFDLDGTLTDTLESLTYSVNETLKEMGLHTVTADQCRRFVGNGARKLIERAIRVSGDPEALRIEEAADTYARIFSANCTYHVTPYEGITETIKGLKEKGIKLAVLSNKPHNQTVDVVEEVFGKGVFRHIQGQRDDFPRKPDPKAAFYIAEELGVLPEECMYIGDSEVDIHTGKAAGMHTIGVNWGFRTKEILLSAGATHTIDRPEELLKEI